MNNGGERGPLKSKASASFPRGTNRQQRTPAKAGRAHADRHVLLRRAYVERDAIIRSNAQQRLDCATFIHRFVPFRDVLDWQMEIEHLARIDFALKHELH